MISTILALLCLAVLILLGPLTLLCALAYAVRQGWVTQDQATSILMAHSGNAGTLLYPLPSEEGKL